MVGTHHPVAMFTVAVTSPIMVPWADLAGARKRLLIGYFSLCGKSAAEWAR